MYIITAWDDASEHTVRSVSPEVIVQKAKDLLQQGMRITIVRTVTGDTITVPGLKQEFADDERT